MLVQAGLCRTCSETTLLVFPRGGSNLTRLAALLENLPVENGDIVSFDVVFVVCVVAERNNINYMQKIIKFRYFFLSIQSLV